jgi:DNA-binding NarL/FixJ family response regulator
MPLRCLLVDDSVDFLAAASALLERQSVIVAGVASTSAEALERARELRPDVALVDIELGDELGTDLAHRLADELGGPRVILISAYAGVDFADLVASCPAVGFLPKSAVSARAIHALLRAANERRDSG